MARPRSDTPKSVQVLFRLTQAEADVLETVAYLHRTTSNEFARREIIASIGVWSNDANVIALIMSRATFEARPAAQIGRLPGKDDSHAEQAGDVGDLERP